MEVYLIRHTETVVPKEICYGISDVDLKEPFLEEFEKIKLQVPSNIQVYSSPLKRCKLLAQHITSEIIYDDKLKEFNFGDWEMKSWNEIDEYELNEWMYHFDMKHTPNGEGFYQLYDRVAEFTEKIIAQNQDCVIVTHAGVIRSFLTYKYQTKLKDAFSLYHVNFGEVIKIEF